MPIVGLLSPFWRSIAPNVVKSLHSRPQIAQLLSDLLGVTVAGFLALTQSYTLPYLILYQKQSLILRILQARGDGSTVQSMCLENANLASTLALLLVQQSNDIETSTLTLLRHASAEFGGVDLADLVRSGPFYIAFELLLSAADEDAGARAKIHQAIHLLATLTHRRGTQSKSSSASAGGMVGAFFQTHVLGIMSHFAEVINAPREGQLAIEKKRCLKGIEEMIRLAKQHVANALPQICACLQSALEIAELRLQALSTWMTMVASLGDDDVEPMIDSIFSIIVQSWDNFSPIAKEQASAIIEHLVNRHRQYILENVDRVPSLSSVMELGKFETEIEKVRARLDIRQRYLAYSTRCRHENVTVVRQTLAELLPYLKQNQSFIHLSAVSEQPDPVIPDLLRSILDACVKFAETGPDISRLCSECIGLIGCSDPNRVEALREDREVVVLSNFDRADETIDWVMFFVQDIVVKAFMSATNTKGQGFLAWAMQELLKICDLDTSVVYRTRDAQNHPNLRRWYSLPESVRNTLTPFLNSKYVVSTAVAKQECQYPIFSPQLSHGTWLRTFVTDLLQKGIGDNARMIFPVCARIIRSQDISIASFLLPFVALNVVIGADEQQAERIGQEMLSVLQHQASQGSQAEKENLRLCSETVFHLLDYLSRWMQEKKKELASIKAHAGRHTGRLQADDDLALETAQIRRVEKLLSSIPAEDISRRAIECKSFARALFHWEQHIRQVRDKKHTRPGQPTLEALFERLQDIYTQIDEPDGIEGISAHLHVLNIDQQILEHRKAGRWTAAQSWYELRLAEQPDDLEIQASLLACLKESGQHEGMNDLAIKAPRLLPFVVEAAWNVGKWSLLEKHLSRCPDRLKEDFNVGVGQALLNLRQEDHDGFISNVDRMRGGIANSLSRPTTASLQTCHDQLLKFHVLSEMELIGRKPEILDFDRSGLLEALDRRLEVLGAFLADKQYLLGVRRATMRLSGFPREDMASAWLTTAKLARKGGFVHQSFNAVLHASQLGAESATIEHSRLLWKEGQHRKAIQSLEGAIAVNAFKSYNRSTTEDASVSLASGADKQQNTLQARATLLLAKWLDSAGQTQSQSITEKYREAANLFMRWEKGHYYLGRHYDKLLASEKALPPHKQAMPFITGETAKLVVQNYLRSLGFGAKYIFQTLPRLLTLWLDLGSEATRPIDPKYGQKEEFRKRASADRKEQMQQLHVALKKYQAKLPAFVFYTALPQIVARICHPNKEVFAILQTIIVKVVSTHPQQALWTLLAVVKSSNKDRAARGATCLSMIKEQAKRGGGGAGNLDLKSLISQGQKLSEQLLGVCEGEIHGKPTNISLSKDLGFTQKSASCPMVVPLEKTLTASLPTVPDRMRGHKAFSRDTVTISGFLDEVLVLNSLQRPRKITVRGSDGRSYGLLCKPKDDLRKDQRLMEFNAMINRSLKRDADSSKRQLYIKTYAVTPLNEECGLIEWVDGLKTMRDILLKLYRSKSITPNYAELRILLDEIAADPSKISIFTDKILPSFPPVFHEWFVEMFPDPGAWFASRLRYTRSCAVMSMVGMVLGLGDRHGENILFEEGTGGTFHVDFNCLFDKGLTFDKPEMVPFRLTRNMVDAFGVYGYEGPFRKACELTLRILRQNEDTLMTILETFVYDPTTDFIGKKKRHTVDVPDTPQEVLDSVRGKVRGLLRGESVPLSVEGHVHELIQQAVSPANLAAMYIGWCAFL
ncbi:MAG: serine/threonine-protein kinase M1 [Caeruleum heppii]|nr:MAG: serine/threonine-protein kinase M1 [Caeruleum heppii]